ncbi:hypothetical protein L6452_43366 [Arctium lappa]|uniref:Uncharacterized protein n=1 Tax=Arctium lappa TaxID=4217 RepID=A0ACB8XLE6_ARCLA|nr:hypothetical protein L6452_43366 [Arctium lappa]
MYDTNMADVLCLDVHHLSISTQFDLSNLSISKSISTQIDPHTLASRFLTKLISKFDGRATLSICYFYLLLVGSQDEDSTLHIIRPSPQGPLVLRCWNSGFVAKASRHW